LPKISLTQLRRDMTRFLPLVKQPGFRLVIWRHRTPIAYKWCHPAKNYFAKVKGCRTIATRHDKTVCSYAANWNLFATLIASR